MEATELRIGNLAYREDLGSKEIRYTKILELGKKALTTGPINVLCDYKDLNPITLTDEFLEYLGAKKSYDSYLYDRFKLIWKTSYKYWYVLDKESLTYLTKIEFVHEWQNFVFAMNNKELEIND